LGAGLGASVSGPHRAFCGKSGAGEALSLEIAKPPYIAASIKQVLASPIGGAKFMQKR